MRVRGEHLYSERSTAEGAYTCRGSSRPSPTSHVLHMGGARHRRPEKALVLEQPSLVPSTRRHRFAEILPSAQQPGLRATRHGIFVLRPHWMASRWPRPCCRFVVNCRRDAAEDAADEARHRSFVQEHLDEVSRDLKTRDLHAHIQNFQRTAAAVPVACHVWARSTLTQHDPR